MVPLQKFQHLLINSNVFKDWMNILYILCCFIKNKKHAPQQFTLDKLIHSVTQLSIKILKGLLYIVNDDNENISSSNLNNQEE